MFRYGFYYSVDVIFWCYMFWLHHQGKSKYTFDPLHIMKLTIPFNDQSIIGMAFNIYFPKQPSLPSLIIKFVFDMMISQVHYCFITLHFVFLQQGCWQTINALVARGLSRGLPPTLLAMQCVHSITATLRTTHHQHPCQQHPFSWMIILMCCCWSQQKAPQITSKNRSLNLIRVLFRQEWNIQECRKVNHHTCNIRPYMRAIWQFPINN